MRISPTYRILSALALAAMAVGVLAPGEAQAGGPYQFYAISPCRVYDTRAIPPFTNNPLPSSVVRAITVKNNSGNLCGAAIPSDAAAVVVNVTVVGPAVQGFLTLYPGDIGSPPLVATLTFNAGEPALGNGAIVPLAATATNDMNMVYGVGGPGGSTHVVMDATGYFK